MGAAKRDITLGICVNAVVTRPVYAARIQLARMAESRSPTEELSDSSHESSLLSLSCSFSSFEHDYEDRHSEADDEDSSSEDVTGTVEPYLYEPEESSDTSASSSDDDEGSSDEGRIGNTDW